VCVVCVCVTVCVLGLTCECGLHGPAARVQLGSNLGCLGTDFLNCVYYNTVTCAFVHGTRLCLCVCVSHGHIYVKHVCVRPSV
jgi:hypothetical protein